MTVMEWLRNRFPEVFGTSEPPVIMTEWGPTTESARLQGAINMKLDPEHRKRVEKLMVGKYSGNVEAAMKEMKRRYPEAYK